MKGAVMTDVATLPMLTAESSLTRYLEDIRRFPMLEPQREYMLAKRWCEHGDRDAAHRLVRCHLRLVAKIAEGYRGDSGEWQDWLVDESANRESRHAQSEEPDSRRRALGEALTVLNDRERRVFEARRLADEPITLEELANELGVSRDRVRQIDVRAFEQVQKALKTGAIGEGRVVRRKRESCQARARPTRFFPRACGILRR